MAEAINTNDVKHLQDFFNDLSIMDQKKIFLEAFRKSAKPLVQRTKANVPQGSTKKLFRSIGTMAVPNEIAILVGAKKGMGQGGWKAHFVENGTTERIRSNGGATGRVTGTHFFENSYGNTDNEIEQNTEHEFYVAIDNMIVRVNKKLNKL